MEIWQYIEILRQPRKTWFFSKDNTAEKINALSNIAINGYSSDIYYLVDFLKDGNSEIREATVKTVINLFKKIDSKKGYFNTLKYCNISKSDIDYYEANYCREQYIELLAISSLNGNGYVREKAVKKLSEIDSPRAIQFLIYRLADWVLPIQQLAKNGIDNYKTKKYIDSLIENLPIFEWLEKVGRIDLSNIYQEFVEFITSKNREYVIDKFENYPDQIRILLARHISKSPISNQREINLFLRDKHFIIRSLAINYFADLGPAEIKQLLNDKSGNIRLQTLYCLKNQPDFEKILINFLADNSSSVRQFARFRLKHSNIDFAKFYYDKLNEGKQVNGSLIGLTEIDDKSYPEKIKSFLNDNKVRVKKTAFLVLCKIDAEDSYNFAVANLDSSYLGLRNVIIEYLSQIPRPEVMERAVGIYETGNYDLKKSMLKLFHKIGGLKGIPDLMIGTIDENEKIRELAFDYLGNWRERAARLFVAAKQDEIERAQRVFNFVYETHDEKQYFESNPVEGLNFYFK
ncbi:HEAT repeat domain-containing protein [Sphingobacterium endophyticum]|uniref:HEAT repeat domain-containing protein n=1 Tax=Sphingobacterium endophyticum TaxID=2546448 RepID=UPI0012E138E5|nr:hypothetical protein [Sphingobacterium endophyticum]